jgi:signal transduction histidine kinase
MSNQKIKVLFIDDEVHNLHAFKAAFRFDYDIAIAESAAAAEQWLDDNNVQVILCDQRMPGKTGIEFFSTIIKKHPKTMRILVTGYTDIESVIKAINQGHVFKYINKPWNDADIRTSIDEAYKFYMQSLELESKINDLSKAYKDLDNFAYSVSHDMKGPLMSILGAMNIVNTSTNKNEKTVLMMLDLIEKAAIQLNEFIESMHVYYKNNRGKLKIEPVNLYDIKTEIEGLLGLKCMQEKIQLNFTVQNHANADNLYRTDITKLKVVVNNLVSNALKYQRPEELNKYVNANLTIDNDMLTITVEDNGMGIDNKYLNNIFELFFRATTEVGGSGFGLYNVKEIITTLGGTIHVTSELNKGTTFTVKLPSK